MEDEILNLNADGIVMRETQPTESPATFSHKLIDRFDIRQHTHSSEAVDQTYVARSVKYVGLMYLHIQFHTFNET